MSSTGQNKSVVREYIEAILVAVLLALFVRTFVVQAFKIPSGSMLPTLQIGDHLLVNKFSYGVKLPFIGTALYSRPGPARDDVVVFRFPEIARLIISRGWWPLVAIPSKLKINRFS